MKLQLFYLLLFELQLTSDFSLILILSRHFLDSLTHYFIFFARDFLFLFNINERHVEYHCFLLICLFWVSVDPYLLVNELWQLFGDFLQFFSNLEVFLSKRSKLIDCDDKSLTTFRSQVLRVSSILLFMSRAWRLTLLLINLEIFLRIIQILFQRSVIWCSMKICSLTIWLLKTVGWLDFWFWN